LDYTTLFFYDIQALGETNSHQYLIKTSSEYINFEDISEEVQALQAEIAQLREDLLKAQMDLISTQVNQQDNPESNSILSTITKEIQEANSQLINAPISTGNVSAGTSSN